MKDGGHVSMTMAAKTVRHFEPGAHHSGSVRRYHRQRPSVERALRASNRGRRNMGVARHRRQAAVPEQDLNTPDIRSVLQQVSSETVPKCMHANLLEECQKFRVCASDLIGPINNLNLTRS